MERKGKNERVTIEALEARLKTWRIDLKKLRAKATTTAGHAKTELGREVAKLRAKLNEGQTKLERLKKTGKGEPRELLKEIGKAYAKLRKGIRRPASR
jgi:hypothetical protein